MQTTSAPKYVRPPGGRWRAGMALAVLVVTLGLVMGLATVGAALVQAVATPPVAAEVPDDGPRPHP